MGDNTPRTVGEVAAKLTPDPSKPPPSDAELYANLAHYAKGDFSIFESGAMGLAGIDPKGVQRMAAACKQITDNEFGGNAKAALNFLQTVQKNPSIKNLDFTTLVNDGAAHLLIQMSRQNPAGFNKVMQGNYMTPASLLASVTPPPAAAPAQQPPALATTRPAAPATRPAVPRSPS